MSMFQRKPVIIEAEQFDGYTVPQMLMRNPDTTVKGIGAYYDDHAQFPISLTIETLDGNLKPNPGDWIIKGPGSEWSICKREVFGKTYYAVGMDDDPIPPGPDNDVTRTPYPVAAKDGS